MGCTQSSNTTAAVASTTKQTPAGSGPKRINKTCAATFGGVSVRYAYLSQSGYYPDDPTKPNQDAYVTSQDFAGRDADAFFGVFDGHGEAGDKCAQFARKKIPSLLSKATIKARAAGSEAELSEDTIREVLVKTHKEVDMKMHRNANIDDSLSGTTAVSLYLHGRQKRITISNVGDSRAVIGRTASTDGKETLKAFALSEDQTPYRLDERVRLRKAGARIRTVDQITGVKPIDKDEANRDEKCLREGDDGGGIKLGEEIDREGDPPRVFDPNLDAPGCAFSRSIGDYMGEGLGVIPDPEVATWEVTPEDRVIVLASDGVFEFLTNQAVVDMCAAHADPLVACQAVVVESYRLWMKHEQRADDITMICIFVDSVDASKAPDACSLTAEKGKEGLSTEASRPLGRGINNNKHVSDGVTDVTVESDDDSGVEPLTVQLTS